MPQVLRDTFHDSTWRTIIFLLCVNVTCYIIIIIIISFYIFCSCTMRSDRRRFKCWQVVSCLWTWLACLLTLLKINSVPFNRDLWPWTWPFNRSSSFFSLFSFSLRVLLDSPDQYPLVHVSLFSSPSPRSTESPCIVPVYPHCKRGPWPLHLDAFTSPTARSRC